MDMKKPRLVMIGNGMAGCRAVEEILKRDPNRYEIAIFGTEPRVNYNRIMLSSVLAGERAADEITLNPLEWYLKNDIALRLGVRVVDVDAVVVVDRVVEGARRIRLGGPFDAAAETGPLISAQHRPDVDIDMLMKPDIIEHVIQPLEMMPP